MPRDRGRDRSDRERDRAERKRRHHSPSSSSSRHHKSSTQKEDPNSNGNNNNNSNGTTQSTLSLQEKLRSKEVLYNAKMEIQQRLKNLTASNANFPGLKSASVLKPEEASAFVDLQIEKVNRLRELKSRLNKNVPAIVSGSSAKPPPAKMAKRDTSSPDHSGFNSVVPIELRSDTKPEPIIEYLDPRIHVKSAQRPRRPAFSFKEQGEYQKLANMQRNKAKLEKLQSEISRAAKQTGISAAVKLAIVTPSGAESIDSYVPDVEWWDEVVLGNGKNYDNIPSPSASSRYEESITDLVEHPIQLKPPDEPTQPQYIKACLTKKERKKLRRQNRREALKEKMEKVRLGLEKPPEPKLKISNLMRVLGSDAIQDPTKMEAHVRKQIADRLQKHKLENSERQLTREQRSAKAIRKLAEDTSLAIHVAIYMVKSLANPSKKFKVHMNAKQLQMTGIMLMLEDINVIIVEGGPKQQKFYKKLMMKRIKWADEIAGQKKEISRTKDDQGERNECSLIWEGIIQRRSFGEPRYVVANNHKHAREILDKHGVPHYWDLCYSTNVLLTSDE